MSFEGYYQVLCHNGHLTELDVYAHDSGGWHDNPEEWLCPSCDESEAWRRVIDTTNGPPSDNEYAPLIVLSEAIYDKCNMGHTHMVKPAVYQIPEKYSKPTYHSAVAYVTVRLDLLVLDGVRDEEAAQQAVQAVRYDFSYADDTVSIEDTDIVDVSIKETKE